MARDAEAIDEVRSALNSIDNIETIDSNGKHDLLVKVMDESAVGQFFQLRRSLDASFVKVTRNDLSDTVLDALVNAE